MKLDVVATGPPVPTLADTHACLHCGNRDRIERSIGFGGRVVSVVCRACRLTSLYQQEACAECGALERHTDACSFATLWGV